MLVYYSVLVFILLAAICSSLAKKGIYKDLFFQIAAFLLFLVMAIRYGAQNEAYKTIY